MELLRAITINYATQDHMPSPHELVDTYGEAVYNFCRSIAYSKEEADDLFQETYLKAIENLPKIKESPKGFLFATAIYIAKSWKRKHARRNRLAPASQLDEKILSDTDIEGDYAQQEDIRIVRQLVDALPEKYKIPTLLFYNAELGVSDIATALGIPTGTVKSRLHKARKIVEKGLVKNGYK